MCIKPVAQENTELMAITGNTAIAQAMRQINPDVVAIYPITPQTDIAEEFSDIVAKGLVDTELIPVESEHSAMSLCVGASSAGARTMTATCSQGLGLMWEVLYIASGLRLPIVMSNVNRALSSPINIHCDHSDSMGARDSGWIQLYSENAQEAYDNLIQAVRIAEHKNVRLPVMVNLDGFIISHSIGVVELLQDPEVSRYIGTYHPPRSLLDIKNPVAYGFFDGLHGHYFEFKKSHIKAMEDSKEVIVKVGKEYGRLSGREYGLFEGYKLKDAEVAVVVLNSAAGTIKTVIDELRDKGIPVGLLKLRVFRPFPAEEIAEALSGLRAVAVLDRATSPGLKGGPLFSEIKSALYDAGSTVKTVNYLYGLGGREFNPRHAQEVFSYLLTIRKNYSRNALVHYLD